MLEGDSISLAFKAHIHSCLGKEVWLWLIVRPSIYSFCIAHFIFTLALCFHLGLFQPSASSFLTCEYGHMLDAFGMHLIHCPIEGQQITT
jgi:hypothetical protein